jgi:hypothetical protein
MTDNRPPLGLYDLLAGAAQRALTGGAILHWALQRGDSPEEARDRQDVAAELAVSVLSCAAAGDYRTTWLLAALEGDLPDDLWGYVEDLDSCPAWVAFVDVAELAERIDSFLAVQERAGLGARLAKDCRADLDLLPVLADWCADGGQPAASAEARHLHGLVRAAGV